MHIEENSEKVEPGYEPAYHNILHIHSNAPTIIECVQFVALLALQCFFISGNRGCFSSLSNIAFEALQKDLTNKQILIPEHS